MWVYEKKLQFPVNIKKKDLKLANAIIAQYGGPDGELSAAIRYLNQRYNMPTSKAKGLLTDIGTEELAHVEVIAAIVYQLTRGATPKELEAAGLQGQYTLHDNSLFPADPNGVPWTAAYIADLGDPIANIHEDMAAEQKARATYEHILNLTDDKDVIDVISFLREREVVHFQRFGELLNDLQFRQNMRQQFFVPNVDGIKQVDLSNLF